MDPITLTIGMAVVNVGLAVIGYLIKMKIEQVQHDMTRQVEATDRLRAELNEVKVNYVHKADFGTFETRLWERFDRLEDKLDNR